MLKLKQAVIFFIIILVFKTAYTQQNKLYNTVVHLDSVFFEAYNTCNIDKQASIYSDTIEFYHDQGGLMTSKQAILDATQKLFAGK